MFGECLTIKGSKGLWVKDHGGRWACVYNHKGGSENDMDFWQEIVLANLPEPKLSFIPGELW